MPIISDKGLHGATTTFDMLHINEMVIKLLMLDASDPSMDVTMSWYAQNSTTKKKDFARPDVPGSEAQMKYSIGNVVTEAKKAYADGDMRTVVAVNQAMAWIEEAVCCLTMRKLGVDRVGNLTSTQLIALQGE